MEYMHFKLSLKQKYIKTTFLFVPSASAKVEVNMVEKVEVYLGETAEINCSFTSDDGISGSGGLLIKWFHVSSLCKSRRLEEGDTSCPFIDNMF